MASANHKNFAPPPTAPISPAAAHRLAIQLADDLQAADPAITGFNFGANDGLDAGQSVFHCHLHLIPRRAGDHPAPRGGIRGVIPHKAHY